MPEYWDVYSKDKIPLNKIVTRKYEFHSDEYHLGVIALIINSDGKILMTKRTMAKEKYPGKWEFTQGGVIAGESSRDGIIREINEEIGIKVNEKTSLKCLIHSYVSENTILDVWLFNMDIDINKTILQESEVDDIKFVDKNELYRFINNNQTAFDMTFIEDLIENEIIDIR